MSSRAPVVVVHGTDGGRTRSQSSNNENQKNTPRARGASHLEPPLYPQALASLPLLMSPFVVKLLISIVKKYILGKNIPWDLRGVASRALVYPKPLSFIRTYVRT